MYGNVAAREISMGSLNAIVMDFVLSPERLCSSIVTMLQGLVHIASAAPRGGGYDANHFRDKESEAASGGRAEI